MRKAVLGTALAAIMAIGLGGCSSQDTDGYGGHGGQSTGTGGGGGAGQGGSVPDGGGGGALPAELQATIDTSMGEIVLELNAEASPITVQNFRDYADAAFYDGLIFHRVIAGFMIQGGGLHPDMTTASPLFPPIVNEAVSSGLSNVTGTIAMARTSAPDSATSQFFINTVDNTFLDPGESTDAGYAVFGAVVAGMDVVTAIEAVATTTVGQYQDVPVDTVLINSIVVEEH